MLNFAISSKPTLRTVLGLVAACWFIAGGLSGSAQAQLTIDLERSQGRDMLQQIVLKLKDNYYDPTFHGVDLDAQYKDAEARIKTAKTADEVYTNIARFLLLLDDSHTYFIPPDRYRRYDYGFKMQTVGEACFVTAVKPGSDADAKGLKEGDQVLAAAGMKPSRPDFWLIQYLINTLHPRDVLPLVVKTAGAGARQIDVTAKVTKISRVVKHDDVNAMWRQNTADDIAAHENRDRYVELGKIAFVWKMTAFDIPPDIVDSMIDRARKFPYLILDLRDNPGGYEDTMERLIGNLFDHEIKIGDLKQRKTVKPDLAKSRGKNSYAGKVIVLIDSESASSAEILARVVQLEGRGIVIGDRSAGAVMRALFVVEPVGVDTRSGYGLVDTRSGYGLVVTDADIIMKDGNSLEKVGVTPDELLLPAQADLTSHKDPVLARAAALAGVNLDPAKAGTLFPTMWKK